MVSAVPDMSTREASVPPDERRLRVVIVVFLALALLLGALRTWSTRYGMDPDSISYLDMGDVFPVLVVLPQDALDALRKVFPSVVDGRDHAHEGLGGIVPGLRRHGDARPA
jgi:hypothetical protein